MLTSDFTTGFGTAQNSGFGAKPAFGAPATSTGSGLFGSTTTTNTGSGFGGFGSANNTTSSPFGSTNTGGGLFGSTAKPAFGATNTTTTPFGGGTSTGFGSTTSAFGGTGNALGGPVGECQGTGAVPFTPYIEKEPNSTTNQQNAFQSIVFLPPYQKFSPEELRLADYAQGRRYGNASGQAGAFGANTSFGGFGANNTNTGFGTNSNASGGLFGSTSNNTPFGTQTTNTGFGSNTNTTGGLFGAAKPATTGGGLFGSTTATTGTGLFGSGTGSSGFGNNNTSTGFGTSNTTGSSLFSGNQNKSPFSFGTQQPSTTGTGFGTGTTGGFGSTGSSLFGNTQNQSTTPAFGASNTTNSNPFGGFGSNTTQQQTGTSSLFSNNAAKPSTGLFGATNTTNTTGAGTSLFGSNTNTTSNPFGGNTNQNQGTSLFGAKPATTNLGGGGLFGSNNANNTTSNTGSLFGSFGQNQNNQSQPQNAGSSLFGGTNNLTNKPSLFGTQPSTGGSLFGGNNPNQGGSSLFGGLNTNTNQQPQQSSLFGGSFGGSQQNATTQPQSLTASISDPTAFGTSMFANLASPQIHNPGPLATPLSSLSKQKKSGVLPMHKMNPGSLSRYSTPPKRGFGFSYSTYGTPGSASSTTSTPITFGNSMLGSGLNRGLTKSVSTSSLRGSYTSSFNREDSILAPGAFSASPNSRFNSTGSMKKLVINRSIRTDLFSPPPKDSSSTPSQGGILKKRVSFDSSTVGGNSNGPQSGSQNGNHNGFSSPLKQVQSSSATPTSEEMGYLRSSGRNGSSNGSKTNGTDSEPEMEQVKGNELAIVPEEEAPAPAPQNSRTRVMSQEDQEPGRYWVKPTKEEIMDMNRSQRQKVTGFTVGREGVGQVAFDVPVDLTNIDLDSIFDKIVILNIRQATVYPDQSKKPPMGKGLNVPATIQLQNSWPRGKDKRNPSHEKSGPRFQKHIERLAKVPNTQFKDYNKETGVWTFTVEHFTTYGLEYDDDETDGEGMSEFGQSTLSAPPDTPTPQSRAPKASAEASFNSSEMSGVTESDPDDTFDFKKKKILPGAFDDQAIFEDDAEMQDDEQDSQSFLDERSVGSQSENGVEEPMDQDDNFQSQELVRIEDQEMAGSYPLLDDTAEHDDEYSQEDDMKHNAEDTPGAIMRARMRAMRTTGSPLKRKLKLDDDDWTDMLRRTLSPQKQDREQLKRMRDSINDGAYLGDKENRPTLATTAQGRVVSDGRGFATSIDLMHSLFGEAKSPVKILKAPAKSKGFEVGLLSCA
jgi:nuclear pore complex protein Nup98-Nup96